jgi:hypothetical protein
MNCGSHGTLDEYGQCVCAIDPGYTKKDSNVEWSGVYCQRPPSNVPCKPSSKEERERLGGDLSCGNWGQYGICNSNGTCDCGIKNPFRGSRCQNECQSDMDCGGPKVPYHTPDGTINRDIGVCNRANNRCVCKNGWSGVQCRTPPPDAKAYDESDCYWGGVQHGTFDAEKQTCMCLKDLKGRPLYEGPLCATPVIYEGAPCSDKEPCRDKKDKCVMGKCEGPDTGTPGVPVPDQILAALGGLISLESIAFMLVDQGMERTAEFLVKSGVTAIMTRILEAKIAKLAQGELFDALVSRIGVEAATKALSQAVADDAIKKVASSVIKEEALQVGEAYAGKLDSILFVLAVWSMVLDVRDVRGLNAQMLQDNLDTLGMKFQNYLNETKSLVDAGITLPLPFFPEYNVPFNIQLQSKDKFTKYIQHLGDYISALTVNSDGQVIVPLFNPPDQVERNERKAKYPLYWKMAQDNNDVFDRLTEYGWIMWLLGAFVVVFIVLTCVFSAPAVKRRLQK